MGAGPATVSISKAGGARGQGGDLQGHGTHAGSVDPCAGVSGYRAERRLCRGDRACQLWWEKGVQGEQRARDGDVYWNLFPAAQRPDLRDTLLASPPRPSLDNLGCAAPHSHQTARRAQQEHTAWGVAREPGQWAHVLAGAGSQCPGTAEVLIKMPHLS